MEPVTTAALVAAGSQLGAGAIGAINAGNLNRKNRRWNEEMYVRQLQDARDNWRLQNEYNSPSNQRRLLEEANLNPALMYGKGAGSSNAGAVSNTNAMQPDFKPHNFGAALGNAGMAYLNTALDLERKSLENSNLRSQGTVLAKEAVLKDAMGLDFLQSSKLKKFNLDFEKDMRGVSGDFRKAKLRELEIGNMFQLAENDRRTAMNAASLKEALSRILLNKAKVLESRASVKYLGARTKESKAQVDNLYAKIKEINASVDLKLFEKALNDIGVHKGDKWWVRLLGYMTNGAMESTVRTHEYPLINFDKRIFPNK